MNFYDEAIQGKHDLQLDLIRRQRTLRDIATTNKSVQELETSGLVLRTLYNHDIAALEDADPYFWAPRLTQLVLATGQQLPMSARYDASWLRGKAGYWWFGRSSPLVGISRDNERKYVSSLLWNLYPNGTLAIQTFYLDGRIERSLGALTWEEGESLGDALRRVEETKVDVTQIPDLAIRETAIRLAANSTALAHELVDVTRQAKEKHEEVKALAEQLGKQDDYVPEKYDTMLAVESAKVTIEQDREKRFSAEYRERLNEWSVASKHALVTFACGCLWLKQKIVTASQAPLTRAAQRRLMRAKIDPKCLVVELRGKQYTRTTGSEEDKHTDWAWQWAVRGHWRDQPIKEGSKLIWIHPYIKGPEDRPLKPDAARVFAVTR